MRQRCKKELRPPFMRAVIRVLYSKNVDELHGHKMFFANDIALPDEKLLQILIQQIIRSTLFLIIF